jgi:hypothetical protein
VGKLENIVSAAKLFMNYIENILLHCFLFPELGKQGNFDRKHNVSATMALSLPRALEQFDNFRTLHSILTLA